MYIYVQLDGCMHGCNKCIFRYKFACIDVIHIYHYICIYIHTFSFSPEICGNLFFIFYFFFKKKNELQT
jgi:hypothetical protein